MRHGYSQDAGGRLDSTMEDRLVRQISPGLSQRGVRDHNGRLLLSLVQRHGPIPASDLARRAGLSPPTVSSILRRLEAEGLLDRGQPVRGRVGKPSVPMRLAPEGAFAFGLKIGRRSAELVLIDLTGALRHERHLTYAHPAPGDVLRFVEDATATIVAQMGSSRAARISGIGVAAPFELWNGAEVRAGGLFPEWRDIDLRAAIGTRTGLGVTLMNDATAACQAEHTLGRGKAFRDYAYFFVGTYVGGGVVLNNAVYEGRQNNAGALGSLRSIGPNGESLQLVDTASIRQLEQRLQDADVDARRLWSDPNGWDALARHVEPWIGQTAQELAKAAMSTCSVIDFEAVLIDGAFPEAVRDALVSRVRRYVENQDTHGLIRPVIEAGSIGRKARAIGAATHPINLQFMLNAALD